MASNLIVFTLKLCQGFQCFSAPFSRHACKPPVVYKYWFLIPALGTVRPIVWHATSAWLFMGHISLARPLYLCPITWPTGSLMTSKSNFDTNPHHIKWIELLNYCSFLMPPFRPFSIGIQSPLWESEAFRQTFYFMQETYIFAKKVQLIKIQNVIESFFFNYTSALC